MHWVAQATSPPPGEAPPSLTVAVYSVVVMLVFLGASTLTYLLRHKLERLEQLIQGVDQNRYIKHIQGPAAAVIVAAVSGYGINIVTQNRGLWGYIGFLLAMPLPLAMVTWNGIRAVRQSEFERRWPPPSMCISDRVRVRLTLRRVQAESAHLGTADVDRVNTVLVKLVDEAIPALRARRDRRLQPWLRDHRFGSITVLVWVLSTLACVTVAVLPSLQRGNWTGVYVLLGFVLVVLLSNAALLVVLRGHSRYRYHALVEEVAASAGRIRRRVTEHTLGLTAQS